MALLTVEHISKAFEEQKVLQDISMELHKGELVSILGVSGVGKTTLFHVIAGLKNPDVGDVRLAGESIVGKPGAISYMLQKDLLLPHRTVLDNVILPLLLQGQKKSTAREQAEPYFEQFGLVGCQNKYPAQLSGGMKQRAALLRTYLFAKDVVLLDEPFSALDMLTKQNMHAWYLEMMEKLELSTLLITHDIEEAIMLSDRIYLLNGTPGTITKEIRIGIDRKERVNFALTSEFLEYKKEIMENLNL